MAQSEIPGITEKLYFWVHNAQMHEGLFFDHYFSCLSVRTDINKNGLDLLNLEGSEAPKRQIPGT